VLVLKAVWAVQVATPGLPANRARAVDLVTSIDHCGQCGRSCAVSNATTNCVAGACEIAQCASHFADCDGSPANGCEVNLLSDPANCGGCLMSCASITGPARCYDGQCAMDGPTYFIDCDGLVANGAESNILSDKSNCGNCGNVCKADFSCVQGVCNG
jgi:hypothetical protein